MDENSPEAQFNKMMEQMAKQQQMPPGIKRRGPTLDEQKVLNTIQTGTPVNTIAPAQGTCPECGMIHPPVQPGKKCPNAKVQVEAIPEVALNEFVIKVRDILVSQVEQKNVKDFKKFSGGMIIEVMKYCEGYKE